MNKPILKRKKRNIDNPNYLFLSWLEEWREKSISTQSNAQYTYAKAIRSLKRYPLPITIDECVILKGFGPGLCKQLKARLETHRRENPDYDSSVPNNSTWQASKNATATRVVKHVKGRCIDNVPVNPRVSDDRCDASDPNAVTNKRRPYRPKPGSNQYVMLVTLALAEEKGQSIVDQGIITETLQRHLNGSQLPPRMVFKSLDALVKRGLIQQTGCPPRFSLTSSGRDTARPLASKISEPDKRSWFSATDILADVPGEKDINALSTTNSSPLLNNNVRISELAHDDGDGSRDDCVMITADESDGEMIISSAATTTTTRPNNYSNVAEHQISSDSSSDSLRVKTDAEKEDDDDHFGDVALMERLKKGGVNYCQQFDNSQNNDNNLQPECVVVDDSSSSNDINIINRDDVIMTRKGDADSIKFDDDDNELPSLSQRLQLTNEKRISNEVFIQHRGNSPLTLREDFDIVAPSVLNLGNKLEFMYVDVLNCEIMSRDQAYIEVVENFGLGFKIVASSEKLTKFTGQYRIINHTKPSKLNYVYAYLHELDAPPVASGHSDKSDTIELHDLKKERSLSDPSIGKTEQNNGVVNININIGIVNRRQCDNTKEAKMKNVKKARVDDEKTHRGLVELYSTTNSTTFLLSDPPTTTCTQSQSGGVCESVSEMALAANSFQIVLCVDNCEAVGGAATKKAAFVKELSASGVCMDVRKLHVGDFLWIARGTSPSGDDSIELVLDWIVERKRLDDLSQSIMDGRYHEQKHRLLKSGVKRVVYLIEEGGKTFQGKDSRRLRQALVNTMITDGFLIVKTRNQKETVDYLVKQTLHLQEYYRAQNLILCRKDEDRTSIPWCYFPFQEFNQAAVKRKRLTIRQMFIKTLMKIRGMSLERAMAICTQYNTPIALMKAYEALQDEKARDKLLIECKCPVSKRNLGPMLSKTVHQLYNSLSFT